MTIGLPMQQPANDDHESGLLEEESALEETGSANQQSIPISTQEKPVEITDVIDVDEYWGKISAVLPHPANQEDQDHPHYRPPEGEELREEDDNSMVASIDVDTVEMGTLSLQINTTNNDNSSNHDEPSVVKAVVSTMKSVQWSNFLMPRSPSEMHEHEGVHDKKGGDEEPYAIPCSTATARTADSHAHPPLHHLLTTTTTTNTDCCTCDGNDDNDLHHEDRHDLMLVHPSPWSKPARPLDDDEDRHHHHSGYSMAGYYLCFCHTMSHRYRLIFLTLLFCSLVMAMLLIVWEMLVGSSAEDDGVAEDPSSLHNDNPQYHTSSTLLRGNLTMRLMLLHHNPQVPASPAMMWRQHDPSLATYGPSIVQRFAIMATLYLLLASLRSSKYIQTITSTVSAPSRWLLLGLLQLQVFAMCVAQQEPTDTTACNFINDTCPWAYDGACDAGYQFGCAAGSSDCYDCDPCHAYSFTNCSACTTLDNDCVWCPGDAMCSGVPLTMPVWQQIADSNSPNMQRQSEGAMGSSCQKEEDWRSTCPEYNTTNNTTTADTTDDPVFRDPLYASMEWSYDLINVQDVWRQGIFGTGVRLRINDAMGVDATHAEFINRFNVNASCDNAYLPPSDLPRGVDNSHGTGVASIAAAEANNGVGAVGIAPQATISACYMPEEPPQATAQALLTKFEQVDISVNSWGPATCYPKNGQRRQLAINTCPFPPDHPESPCEACLDYYSDNLPDDTALYMPPPSCELGMVLFCKEYYAEYATACGQYLDLFVQCGYHTLALEPEQALAKGITEGRNNSGIVFVFAGGNSHEAGADTNFDGYMNTRYTIAVAATDKHGKHASYSTTGAAVFVAAPGGDESYWANNIVARPGGDNACHDIGYGTSMACPVVAGVIALMLEVRPELTWRDAQGILAVTSQNVERDDDDSWHQNAAGIWHSYKYGFGLIDAAAAVAMATVWVSWGMAEQQVMIESGALDAIIEDNVTSVLTSVVELTEQDVPTANFVAESVVVYVDLVHGSRGDLQLELASPTGTASVLVPGRRPENTHQEEDKLLSGGERWKFLTLRNWGESPVGSWTLSIVDERSGILEACSDFDNFKGVYIHPVNGRRPLSCPILEMAGECVNGAVVDPTYATVPLEISNNHTGAEACCVCGGGILPSPINVLRSWRMIVYGHANQEQPDPSLSSTEDIPFSPTNDVDSTTPLEQAETSSVGPLLPMNSSSSQADPASTRMVVSSCICIAGTMTALWFSLLV